MIKKLTCLLENIVGRIKRVMSKTEYFMMVASITFPVGVALIILDRFYQVGILMLGLAMFSWVMAIWMLLREEKQEAEEKQKFYALLSDIHDELRNIRQDRNEHTNKKPK